MSIVCCPLNGPGSEHGGQARSVRIVTAAKPHTCCECYEAITIGARYELYKALWDGRWDQFKTCLSCVEIRNHFACTSGWTFGEVWANLEESFFPDMKAGGPCMEGLSPAAKDRLFTRRLAWQERRHNVLKRAVTRHYRYDCPVHGTYTVLVRGTEVPETITCLRARLVPNPVDGMNTVFCGEQATKVTDHADS